MALALAAAAMATAVIQRRMLWVRWVMRGDWRPGMSIHLEVGAVVTDMAHLGRDWRNDSEHG